MWIRDSLMVEGGMVEEVVGARLVVDQVRCDRGKWWF